MHFSPGINLLYGQNAQGKTNLLEAIYYTALGKSFRPAKEAELIRFGAEGCRMVNSFRDSVRSQCISFTLHAGRGRRVVEQNGVKLQKMSEMVGAFRVVLFCPEHLSLIQGGPELRRAYLNVALSQLRPVYLRALQRYTYILKERNSLLKRAPEDMATFRATEPLWSAQLAREAATIAGFRRAYVAQVDTHAKRCFAEMTGDAELPEMTYQHGLGLSEAEMQDPARVEQRYLELLSTHHDREIAAGATLWGVHKDDICVTLNHRTARTFASQGQQRSLALAMKLAEGDICAKESGGDYPVFLFDDVLSELDSRRRAYLMEEIRGRQVILTTCDPAACDQVVDDPIACDAVADPAVCEGSESSGMIISPHRVYVEAGQYREVPPMASSLTSSLSGKTEISDRRK